MDKIRIKLADGFPCIIIDTIFQCKNDNISHTNLDEFYQGKFTVIQNYKTEIYLGEVMNELKKLFRKK